MLTRSDRVLILTAYILLVGIVAFGAWWVESRFEQAREERCQTMILEYQVAQLLLAGLNDSGIVDDEAWTEIDNAEFSVIETACEDTEAFDSA